MGSFVLLISSSDLMRSTNRGDVPHLFSRGNRRREEAAGGSPAPNPALAPEPAPVYVSAMDTYVPIIPDPKPDDI